MCVSCQKDENDGNFEKVTLSLVFEDYQSSSSEKVYIDDEGYACWDDGDGIVVNGNLYNVVVEDGGGCINGVTPAEDYWATCPSSRYSYDGDKHTFSMPYKQIYATSNGHQIIEAPMYGKSFKSGSNTILKFHNTCALLRIDITPHTGTFVLNKIVITASDAILSGSGYLDISTPNSPTLVMTSGSNSVMLDCGETVISENTSFYICIPPVTSETNVFTVDVVAQNGENNSGDGKYYKFNRTQSASTCPIDRNLIGAMPVDMSAITTETNGFLGAGTSVNPYKIATRLDLLTLRYVINTTGICTTYRALYYEQLCDIDASKQTWKPIATSSYNFAGDYNGGGHTTILKFSSSPTSPYGFFGICSGATVRNLTLDEPENYSITLTNSGSGLAIGGFCGTILTTVGSNNTFSNCTNKINLSVHSSSGYAVECRVAGIVANFNAGTLSMTGCSNEGNIDCSKETAGTTFTIGGLVGRAAGTISTMSGCSNSGGIGSSKIAYYAGGFVGSYDNNKTGFNISGMSENSGSVRGSTHVGGFVGYAAYVLRFEDHAVNSGAIESNSYAGGLLGKGNNSLNILENAYVHNEGDVTGAQYVGGIAGYISGAFWLNNSGENISNSGDIEGTKDVGGIVGCAVTVNAETNTAYTLTNEGSVTGSDYNIGGIWGSITTKAELGGGDISNNSAVKGVDNVGGIIGKLTIALTFSGSMDNQGSVNATSSCVGGIIGYTNKAVTFNSSSSVTNHAAIIGANDVGGIIGYAKDCNLTIGGATINEGNVGTSSGTNVGGIIGKAEATTNGTYTIHINGTTTNSGAITSLYNAGGIIGSIYATSSGKKYHCYINCTDKDTREDGNSNRTTNSASVRQTGFSESGCGVGGILGYANVYGSTSYCGFYNCKNTGEIQTYTSDYAFIGQIAGWFYSAGYVMDYCSADGSITGGSTSGTITVGSFSGGSVNINSVPNSCGY